MRYIYKCIRCEKDIEEVQGGLNETLHIEGAICRDCCRKSVNLYYERTMIGMKKLHWTQTREGRKRMRAIRKKQWKTIRKVDEAFHKSPGVQRDLLQLRKEAGKLADSIVDGLEKKGKKRPNADDAPKESIKDLLELLFDRAEDMQEAARQIADKLGLEL